MKIVLRLLKGSKLTRATLQVNKRTLKWRPFWKKVYNIRIGAIIGIEALINKNTFQGVGGGGIYSKKRAYWNEGGKINSYSIQTVDNSLTH